MASRFSSRFVNRTSLSSLKSSFKSSSRPPPSSSFSPPPLRSTSSPRFNFSRIPTELGCVQSLLPLHSAVATARMTSCLSTTASCRALSQGTLCCTSPGL